MIASGWLAPREDGAWVQAGPEARFGASRLFLPGELRAGVVFEVTPGLAAAGGAGKIRARVAGPEQVEVPALGRAVAAQRVEYEVLRAARRGASPTWRFHRTRWFARGVGIVREVMPWRPTDWGAPPDARRGARCELVLVRRE